MTKEILGEDNEGTLHILLNIGIHKNKNILQATQKKVEDRLNQVLNEGTTFKLIHINNHQMMCTITKVGKEEARNIYNNLLTLGNIQYAQIYDTAKTQSKYSSRLIQSYDHPSEAKLWKEGLNGEGEIIGIGDTGIDIYNCEFYDEKVNIRKLNEVPTEKLGKHEHRKIHSYFGVMDFKDAKGGHGSHVAGLAAGHPNVKLSPKPMKSYRSLAYKAKIAFYDIGCDSPGGCMCPKTLQCECDIKPNFKCISRHGAVFLPFDLHSSYFPYFKMVGASIVSSSWGSGFFHDYTYGYSIKSRQIDQYVWENKEVLPVFAAGNSGSAWGYNTITTEGEAKNALVVGASQNTFKSFLPRKGIPNNFQGLVNLLRNSMIRKFCNHMHEGFSKVKCRRALKFKTVSDCCGTKKDQMKCAGKKHCCGTQKFGLQIGFSCCPKCFNQQLKAGNKRLFSKENIAEFTSRGPASDGRIKPDLVTVGHALTSANSGGSDPNKKCQKNAKMNDQLKKMSGTSMATPIASSAIALIRQFYRQGYYAKHVKKDATTLAKKGFIPSAALMKATAIHSTRVLNGFVKLPSLHLGVSLDYKKGMLMGLHSVSYQGFGAIDLKNVLSDDINLYLPNGDGDRSIQSGELHHYCFKMPKKQDFRVTLVWTDYPSSPGASVHLVNDLDLLVITPQGEISYGNGKYSNVKLALTEPDSLNNVESLHFDPRTMKFSKGYYRVVVRGHHIPHGPQPYALVTSSSNTNDPVTRVRLSRCPKYTAHSDHFIMNQLAHHLVYLQKLGKRTLRAYKKC
eukprot:CAMPEP_0117421372 /NCGR_PEP_ID=MMETSP0758-20121206/2486_1 /TAXON_ID=63605 /ORGANISM="Percolomonas cosmopolitus, Strain AE-1 (ATCC 50343)" /LENGTH=788 /DNA_ID=CAMNT_0005203475 /DNA_START=255 /DNA_END=2618 /DNA_ORIENTATION=+